MDLPVNAASLPDGFSLSPITPDIEARISDISYPKDCPLPLRELRYLTVLHVGFDGLIHQGELVIHQEIAGVILEIFYQLYQSGYPIEKIRLIDEYNADDEASMADNNTSAFCWRNITGTDTVSLHGYGLAIDINPLYNPYVCNEIVSPSVSPYDREAGMVFSPYFMTDDDLCVRLFKSYGFIWGGDWSSPKDYQHFEYGKTAAR
ncbi:MAG: M15 family metallopeptidase [Lachnospiraceae bacterium]|nr:M15 family metallopeptidase [Lachnospiraceae bacterium]